ncbi:MAG: hypothetical protein ACJ8GN_16515 [Longimicrobiaceae bacterium]
MTHLIRPAFRLPALAAALAAALLAGCGGGEKAPEDAPETGPMPPGTQALAAGARLPPPRVDERCYAPPIRTVFHSELEWNAYWTGVNKTCTAPPLPENVDFAREMLVFASIGKRMSPRDSIAIEGSGVRNDSLIVAVRRWVLKDGCPGPRRPTFPQSLVKVPATTAPVRFSEAHIRIPCETE